MKGTNSRQNPENNGSKLDNIFEKSGWLLVGAVLSSFTGIGLFMWQVACGMLCNGVMNVVLLAFVVSALLIGGFLVATLRMESVLEWPLPVRFGDTSLSRNSANWLAVVAVGAAFAICLLLP